MKKISITIAVAVLLSCIPFIVLASDNITVTIDGQEVLFPDQTPVIVENRVLVPVRGVFEALGWDVGWHYANQTALLLRGNTNILVRVGEPVFNVFNYPYDSTFPHFGLLGELDVPAQIIGDRVMLPLRAVLESVGYTLDWDEATSTVKISTPPTFLHFTIQEYEGVTATALELIYTCDYYRYYLSSIRSSLIMLTFEDGTSLSLAEAIAMGRVTIGDLISNGLHVIKIEQASR